MKVAVLGLGAMGLPMATRLATRFDVRAFDVADGDELSSVYERLGSRLGNETEEREVTAAFAAGGLVLLLAGVLTSLRWSGRFPS